MNPNYGYGAPPSGINGPPKGGPPSSSGGYANGSGPPQGSAPIPGNDPNRPAYAPPSYNGNTSVYKPQPPSVAAHNPPPMGQPFGAAPPTMQMPPPSYNPPPSQYGLPPAAPMQSPGKRPLPLAPPVSNRAPSYMAYAPAPLLAPSGNSVGSGLDSKGSTSSIESSGRYTTYDPQSSSQSFSQQQQQQYPPQGRLFNSLSPGINTNTTHNNTTYTNNPAHNTSNSNLSQYNSVPYGDIYNPSVVSPTSGLRRQDANRVDPSQMPHPDKPLNDVVYHTRSGSGRRNPPGGNSIFTAVDTGNCTPRHMRATLVAPPVNKALLDKTGLPFALLATPFASVENGEAEVPMVDLGPLPPRCSRCNGYVNPSVTWGDNGNVWTCNLCSMVNDVPPWYYCSLDGAGHRMDRASRPELQLGSVDFLVNEDYCVRGIQEPIYVFAIDISHKAIANGTTIAAIRGVRSALYKLRLLEAQYNNNSGNSGNGAGVNDTLRAAAYGASPVVNNTNKPRTTNTNTSNTNTTNNTTIRAAIVTFNHNIQYYTVNMTSAEPIKMYEVSGDDPLCPLPHSLLLSGVNSNDTALEHLLQRIPELVVSMSGDGYGRDESSAQPAPMLSRNMSGTGFGGSSPRGTTPRTRPSSGAYDPTSPGRDSSSASGSGESPNCVASVIKSLQEGLHAIGGRVVVVSASHATTGYGKLSRSRERVNLYGTKDEINLYGYASTIMQGGSVNVKDSTLTALSSAATLLGASTGSSASVHASKVQQQQYEQNEEMRALCGLYRDLANACARSTITVSVVACVGDDSHDGGPYFDTALLGEVTTLTGGRLHFFTGALSQEDNVTRLEQQLVGDIEQTAASEAVVKLRTSVGLRVDRTIGPGVHNTVRSEVECSGLDTHATYLFTLLHDTSLKDEERVHYQLAVLHTTPQKQRVIRVHNLTTIASPKPTIVFRNCDIEAVVVALLKEGVDRALTSALSDETAGARGYLDSAVANALYKYRLHCSPASPRGQLVLPDSLKVMPIYTLSMLKHPAILENRPPLGTTPTTPAANTQSLLTNTTTLSFTPTYGSALSKISIRAHERAFELRRLLHAPLVECVNSIYPRLYNISTLFDDVDSDELLIGMSASYDESHRLNSSSEDNQNFSNDSIEVSDEYLMGASTNSVSFNNLLGRNAVGLQLSNPNSNHNTGPNTANNSAVGMLAGLLSPSQEIVNTHNLLLKQVSRKLICMVSPTAEIFEGDQMYLLDDRSTLYLYVGRTVPHSLIDEIMETAPGAGGLGRKDSVSFRPSNEMGRRMQMFCDLLRASNAHKQELKVIWGDMAPNTALNNKFNARLVEDNNMGLMSYVDYLCNMHIKIQAKCK